MKLEGFVDAPQEILFLAGIHGPDVQEECVIVPPADHRRISVPKPVCQGFR
jgi:hypothetical protein